jgi:hypothetical protein
MALGNLLLYPGGVVQPSDRAREAADLRAKLLDRAHTTEIYGPGADEWDVKPEDLMPNPDELHSRWGFQESDKVFDDMASNVLPYGGYVEGRMDVSMALELSWLVGVKGDAESEAARDEIEAAYNAIPERFVVERETCRAAERGFMGAENVFGVLKVGRDNWITTIIEMINKPRKMFAFTYSRQPWFKPHGRGDTQKGQRIDDYKVTFARQGSLHTPYGSGYGQRCYPTVFMIDRLIKQHAAAIERWSWVPVIVRHPTSWTEARRRQEHAILRAQWKNVLLVPDATILGGTQIQTLTEAAYANSNATGMSRMELVKHLIGALGGFVRGSMLSSGNQQEGSYARDQVADSAQLWKAPGDAAAREAMWNRGLVEPTMLANRPNMDRAKWPRCSIDASFGEDLRLFMELCESGTKHGIKIAQATWHERTGIPGAANDDEAVLTAAQSVAPLLPDGMAADEEEDPVTGAVKRLSEPQSIRLQLADGKFGYFRPSQPVLTDKGIVRASAIVGGGAYKLISAGGAKLRAS